MNLKTSEKSKNRSWLNFIIVFMLIGLLSITGISFTPVNTLASSGYSATIAASNSNIGADTELTFSTIVSANLPVLKRVVLTIPDEYSIVSNPPDPIGTLYLSVPSYGVTSNWDVNNGETITAYEGNTNTYTYKIDLDPSTKTVTITAGTGERDTFPDDLVMRFTLNSNILSNPTTTGTYTWQADGMDYNNQSVNLSDLTTTVTQSTGGGGVPAPGGVPVVPPVTSSTITPGGDNTDYNKSVLDVTPTAQDEQAAQLPDSKSTVSPSATADVVLTAGDGVKLTLPPGAVSDEGSPVKLKINIGTIKTAPQADKAAVVLNPLKYERSFGIEGKAEGTVKFAKPVTISFPVSSGDLPSGIKPEQLAVYWWNIQKNDWVKLGGTYDPAQKTISLPTYHFSTYAVMADTSEVPERLSGDTQIDTANKVADYGWKAGADTVVLANAYRFPDALAAAPLAYKYNAPILLTAADVLSSATRTELQKLNPKNIIIVGGTAVVSQAIQDELNGMYGTENVKRYSGLTLYDTASEVAKALGTQGQAVVVNGARYQDALAISSFAAYNGIPILFTKKDTLPGSTADTLKALNVSKTYVAGGTAVVSANAFAKLPGANRYAGLTAADTAVEIAKQLKLNLNHVYVVTSLNFPDALVAGNLAAHTLSPMVMVDKQVPAATFNLLSLDKNKISSLTVIGGSAVVTPIQDSVLRAAVE